jgi:three-Cys-motif partner protein
VSEEEPRDQQPDPTLPEDALWEIEEHTVGKHVVLREYLKAWLPILGQSQGRILFVDGFAGPGRYKGGADGSPVIALKTYLEHSARPRIVADVQFVFIEKDPDCARYLRRVLAPFIAGLRSNESVTIHEGAFDESFEAGLDLLEHQQRLLAPAFVMVDPFGISDTPMAVLHRILRNPRCELYISFMWDWVNRFIGEPAFAQGLDRTFGCREWRDAIELRGAARKSFLFDLYKKCLKDGLAEHVVSFDLINSERGRVVYSIFFATRHALGCDKMKSALWRMDPISGSRFIPADPLAPEDLFAGDLSALEREIGGQLAAFGLIDVAVLDAWIRSDATNFYSGQLRKALRRMESAGKILVHAKPGRARRKGDFPIGTKVSPSH